MARIGRPRGGNPRTVLRHLRPINLPDAPYPHPALHPTAPAPDRAEVSCSGECEECPLSCRYRCMNFPDQICPGCPCDRSLALVEAE